MSVSMNDSEPLSNYAKGWIDVKTGWLSLRMGRRQLCCFGGEMLVPDVLLRKKLLTGVLQCINGMCQVDIPYMALPMSLCRLFRDPCG